MTTYLCKTEPEEYSFADLEREGRGVWDGVGNPAACGYMREVEEGDDVLIYHTGKERAVVGLARSVSAAYPDPARSDLNGKGEVKYPVFDLVAVKPAVTPVRLTEIKADDRFAGFVLVKQARLSVMPVPNEFDRLLREMAGL